MRVRRRSMLRHPATQILCVLLAAEVLSSPAARPQDAVVSVTKTASCEEGGTDEATEKIEIVEPKKKGKTGRSTSSSSGEVKKEEENSADVSLSVSKDSGSDDGEKKKKKNYKPKSTEERHGWRKWHRKCTRCLADEKIPWRSPSISWVCGAYQRARRSFKSMCMMRYRNCQDGTMFVPIHPHRCPDNPRNGEHFFYDYKVALTDDSVDSEASDDDDDEEEESDSKSSSSK